MDSSSLALQTVFGRNTVAKITTDAKKITADKERGSMGYANFQADRAKRANEQGIYEWYQDRDDYADESEEQAASKRRYDEFCVQLTTFAPDYNVNYQRLRIM